MKSFCIDTLIFIFSFSFSEAYGLGFRDFELGMSKDDLVDKLPKAYCIDLGGGGDYCCLENFVVFDVSVNGALCYGSKYRKEAEGVQLKSVQIS